MAPFQNGPLDDHLVEAMVRLAGADFSVRLPRRYDRTTEDALAHLVNTIAEELDAFWQSTTQREREKEHLLDLITEGLMAMAKGSFDHRIKRSFDGSTSDVVAFLMNNTAAELSSLVEGREQRAAELASLRSTRSADRLAAMGTVAAGAAHELATPISSATLFVQEAATLLDRGEPAAAIRPLLETAQEALLRSGELLNDLRIFSRTPPNNTGTVQLDEVIASTARLLRHEAAQRCELSLSTVPVQVRGNEARLGQVFINLLQNALQSIEPGSKSENRVTITMQVSRPLVHTTVRDTGCGMSPEVLSRVFEPFFTTKADLFGTGLGMSVSQATVQGFGGEISVRSQEGVGSLVTVTLPLCTTSARPCSPPSAHENDPSVLDEVLVVDDDDLLLRALERVLRRKYKVSLARTGRDALQILSEEHSPAVVLCDVMMPEMTGPQLYDFVRTNKPELARRFLFLSGGAVTESTRDFLNTVPHILKPVDQRVLLARLRDHIDSLGLRLDSNGSPNGIESVGP